MDKIPTGYMPLIEAVAIYIEKISPDLEVEQAPNGDITGPVDVPAAEHVQQSANFPMLAMLGSIRREVLPGPPIDALANQAGKAFREAVGAREFIIEIVDPQNGQFYQMTDREIASDGRDKLFLFAEIIERNRDCPLAKFDGRTPLVQEKAFRDWLSKAEAPAPNSLTTKERNTLLILLAAALTTGDPDKLEQLEKMAPKLTDWTEHLGAPVSRRAIDGKLSLAREAIEQRMKD